MPRLSELEEFLDEDLTIPLKSKKHPEGRDYVREAPDIDEALWIKGQMRTAAAIADGRREEEELTAEQEVEFNRRVLGPAYDEMIADGVRARSIERAVGAVIAWVLADVEDADDVWSGKARAEAREEIKLNRAERRAEARAKAKGKGKAKK